MKQSIHSISIVILLFCFSNIVFAQNTCTNITITAVGEPSLCRSSGKITVTVSGPDKVNLDMVNAQYQILSVGQGYSTQLTPNGGIFYNVPPGEYNIQMKAFCNIANDWSVFSGKVSVKVDARYIEPNMYIATEEVRKTLNCKVTGMIPVSFFDGKAPYKATITSNPTTYTGTKVFTLSVAGRLEIDNLPEGNYTLSLEDDCGTRRDNLIAQVGKVSSDFPTGAVISETDIRTSTSNCKSFTYIYMRFSPAISESHELFPYLKNANKFYDVFLSEENLPAEFLGTLGTTSISSPNINYLNVQNISLINYTFKDLYPAGGKSADLFLRVKGCTASSDKTPFKLRKPYYPYLSTRNSTCTGFDLYTTQYSDYDGHICYPYTVQVIDADNGSIITSNPINNSSTTYAVTIPWDKRFYVKYIGNDGGEWQPQISTTPYQYDMKSAISNILGTYSKYDYCRDDGITGGIYLYPGTQITSYFIPGTKVKVLSAPTGQVLPPEQTIVGTMVTNFYPYAVIPGSSGNYSQIVPGTHVFEVTAPCAGAVPQKVTVNFPVQGNASYYTYSGYNYCASNLNKFYSYCYSGDTYIPGGTTFTLTGWPTGADLSAIKHGYPTPFTMPSGTSKNFTPFDADYTKTTYTENIVTPGYYYFDVWDANCKTISKVSLYVPSVYSVSDFGYTTEHTSCSNMNVYPTGQMKQGTSNSSSYFRIYSAKNANGTTMSTTDYDTRTITQGQYLSLYKNGTYLIQISAGSGSSCFSDTLSVTYSQPTPSLVLAKTASYVCNGEVRGYIKLEATGGYENGPYEYEIIGSSPLQKNTTGIFDYGAPNENLTIKITDKSAKALQFGCSPSFEQKITMLDLKEASVAYSTNSGNYCEGQTIYLNCIALGNTTYEWTSKKGFYGTGQFLTIPNANVNHTDWYYVKVHPENCGDVKLDSVFIQVHPLPTTPTVGSPDITLCYNSGTYNLTTLTNASALPNYSLRWYLANGTNVTNPSINSYTNTKVNEYYVSQVNDVTGCEGARVKITISIADRPGGPVILYHPDVCYQGSVLLTVQNSNPNYQYLLYNTTSTSGVILDQKAGTGNDLQFTPQVFSTTGSYSTWYVSVMDPVTGCESPRAGRTVNRAASAQAADIIVANDTICSGNSTILTVSAPGITNPIFRWYNGNSTVSTLLYTGDTFTTPTLNGTTNYYVSVEGDGICENLYNQRKSVQVRVLSYSADYYITSSNQTICQGESTTINVSPYYSMKAPIFNWYTSQTETAPFYTGNSYTTPALDATVTYYVGVSSYGQYCENLINNRKAITINTVSKAQVTAPDICPNSLATVNITNARANVVYNVYDQAAGGTLLGTGRLTYPGSLPISIGTHTTSNTFYVQTNDTYCASTAFTPFDLVVKDPPTIYPDIRLQVCPQSGTLLNLTSYLDQNEFKSVIWTNNYGIPISGGNSVDVGLLSSNKSYRFRFDVKNSCYTKSGLLYVRTLGDNGTPYYTPSEVKICKDYATNINLLQLMGIIDVPGGVWDFSSLGSNYTNYIKEVNGAVLFDGEKAYVDSIGDPDLNTIGARRIIFTYTTPPNTCNVPEQIQITIVLTPSLL